MDENIQKDNYPLIGSEQPAEILNTENASNQPDETLQTTVQKLPEATRMVNSETSLENSENLKNSNALTKLMYIGLVVLFASLGIALFINFFK